MIQDDAIIKKQLENSVLLRRGEQNYFIPAQSLNNEVQRAIRAKYPNLKRNDPCICGAKKKFKRCCGRVRTVAELEELTERLGRAQKADERVENNCGSSSGSDLTIIV